MKDIKELAEFIASKHKPELAKQDGMVWQIWEDGELTLQKSGSLLWQRNLHCIHHGLVSCFNKEIMPVQEKEHGYAFIEDESVGAEIRQAMLDLAEKMV